MQSICPVKLELRLQLCEDSTRRTESWALERNRDLRVGAFKLESRRIFVSYEE